MASSKIAAVMAEEAPRWLKVVVSLFVLLIIYDFLVRGIVPSLASAKNDFSDPFVGSWLWIHGQSPWNMTLVAGAAQRLSGSALPVVPIYPLTTYVLVSPFALLPWKWANFFWTQLSVLAIGLVAWMLLQIAGCKLYQIRWWLLVALVLGFTPLHRAIHTENAAVIAVAACLLAVCLAGRSREVCAGALLAAATGLKPQLGIWIISFISCNAAGPWLRPRPRVSVAPSFLAWARIHQPVSTLVRDYQADLRYWFGLGGANDFTAANPLRFQLVNLQIVFWQWIQGRFAANLAAGLLFLVGLGVWILAMLRPKPPSASLALTSLLALSFLSIYHSVTDVSILVLGFCWVVSSADEDLVLQKFWTLLLLLGLTFPTHSILLRVEPHLSRSVTSSWWWTGFLAPSFVWNMLLLNLALLVAMTRGWRKSSPHESPEEIVRSGIQR